MCILSPQEVHETGLREVRRIRDRYRDDVLVPLGMMSKEEAALKGEEGEKLFTSRFKTFVESARVEKDQYFDSEKALLDTYRGTVDRIAKVLPQGYFDTFPKSRVEIVSKNAPSSPAAYYMAGTPDGSRPGRFYVNVSNLKERPKYEMMSLSLHEAIPGHHHQVALAIENKKIPDFLRFLEDRRYEFCPARRQLYAAYLEGWALYCEALGEHMGLYGTPLELFGRLSMEMMRAVRLVVDSGIHHKGWTVHEAIEYMMEQTGMHRVSSLTFHPCDPSFLSCLSSLLGVQSTKSWPSVTAMNLGQDKHVAIRLERSPSGRCVATQNANWATNSPSLHFTT